MKKTTLLPCLVAAFLAAGCATTNVTSPVATQEQHRPQYHFTPPAKWMNDPNGMVYHNGEYHLFYQHHPGGTTWGPMHWGHAVSKDMVNWEHLPIALYPDEHGTIFSGSAVVDVNNTSGLGTKENPPMVAIYTYHNAELEKAGRIDYQTQGIAYSLNNGRTWKKYEQNPVLKNPGIRDFRDPKVDWNEKAQQWVMTLAVLDHIEFYGSKDLKTWNKLSEFGANIGAHGGVWECPDLFPLRVNGQEKWVLLVSINPGGPNGGSATQYFIGDFDGTRFVLDKSFEQALSQKHAVPAGKVIADFEGTTYGTWKAEGEAFGTGPATGGLGNQQKVSGFMGQGLVNSFAKGDGATGKLTSPEFTIDANYLNLRIGGGKHPGRTAVNLLVEGKVVGSATGNNSETLDWVALDTKSLKGKRARLEIVDQETGGWGHLLVDQIMLADLPAKPSPDGIWVDYGTDNYAGVTWANLPKADGRRVFLGWMSNWLYANEVPTASWRSANTVPRELTLRQTPEGIRLFSTPVKELQKLRTGTVAIKAQEVKGTLSLSDRYSLNTPLLELDLNLDVAKAQEVVLRFSNTKGEHLDVGYSVAEQELFIDRTKAGKTTFKDSFAGKHTAPLPLENGNLKLHLLLDVASVEVFANEGRTVMTDIFFPNEDFTKVELLTTGTVQLKDSKAYRLKPAEIKSAPAATVKR
ncbi:glycoside hydrolase family 32 protein [Rufibacter psychrotolerans]|uniref:glycoside hydrolase family 32 protein n=1 Tax=Rufibacter psychrotolerans TaxID=2812556 RepID=UPI0019680F56|nr:glycoside hydrolase family 32 protein [Rufibacter sp. SYSU D00308]